MAEYAQIGMSRKPAPSSAFLIAPTWPSIMPLGATMCAPARACAMAVDAYRSSVESLSTLPPGVTMPQCPWSVYSHRQRSAMTTRSSPTSALMSAMASCEMPSGSSAALPRASLSAGTPNTMMPPTPGLGRLGGRLAQAVARVLHDAGHRADRPRIGDALLDEHGKHELGRAQRRLGHHGPQRPVPRSRRARTSGNPALTNLSSCLDAAGQLDRLISAGGGGAAAAALARAAQRLARREWPRRAARRRTRRARRPGR